MKKSQATRVHWESLQVGERYIMKLSTGEALVTVDIVSSGGISVTVLEGQFKSVKSGTAFRKGDNYTADPFYAEFFEPTA